MLFRMDTYADLKQFWDGIPDPNTCALLSITSTSIRLRVGSPGADLTIPTIVNGNWYVASVVYNGSSSIFRWNGSQQTFSTGTTTTGGITLANSPYHLAGSAITIAAFLQYSGDITGNLPTIEAWLKKVYGLTF
jgi:hypothetical protein